MDKPKSLIRLEENFGKLPSVGKKTAERYAYALFEMDDDELSEFVDSIKDLKTNISICPICGMYVENKKCPICDDPDRDGSKLMVVSYPKDVLSIEKSEGYKGLYHILNGEISINRGQNINDLNIPSLIERLEQNKEITEIIIATNPTIEGETTSLYLAKVLTKFNLTITRLAYGLQMGGNIDYTDQLTLLKALEGRQKI